MYEVVSNRAFFHGHNNYLLYGIITTIIGFERKASLKRHPYMKHPDIREKFKEIYDKEIDSLFHYCTFRVNNKNQAIDIVQDTFIELWQTYQKGVEVKNARALLFTILRNRIIDWYRKKKSLSLDALMENDGQEHSFEPEDSKAYDDIVFGAETRSIVDAINNMDSNYRDVLYLRLIEDKTPEEIANILGTNANTVSVRITRGLQKLREKLGVEDIL